MADRTVQVNIRAVGDNYFATMRKMQAETSKATLSAEASFRKQSAAMETLGRGALATSAVFAGAFVAMVKASADFESRMSQVQAVSKATGRQMEQLRQSAFTAGKAFGLSATQVADAQIELAKAGVSTRDIIGGALPGALALAAAGQLDVAKATEIASNAMTIFGLRGKDLPHVADLLAAGADKSVASVESLGDALNQSGLVANQFGLSVEDTVGTLTAFSKNALNGSDAGTSFKTMLIALANPSKQARAALNEYNIQAYDTRGNFVGITSLAGQLQAGFKGVAKEQRDAALATIFGNDGLRAANVLYTTGASKLQGYIDANNEAGFATLQASKKLDNLNGDVQKLGAALQNDLIGAGSAGQDTLRGLSQTATGLLDRFGDLPKPIQGTALAITGIGAATSLAGAGFLLLTPKIAASKAAMADLGLTAKGLTRQLAASAGIAAALASLASGLSQWSTQGEASAAQLSTSASLLKGGFADLDKQFQHVGNTLDAGTGAARALSYIASGAAAADNAVDGFTFGLTKLGDVGKTNVGTFKAIGEQLGALATQNYDRSVQAFGQLNDRLGGTAESARNFINVATPYKDALSGLAKQAGVAATEQNLLSIATGKGHAADALRDAQAAAAANAQTLTTLAGSAADAQVDISALSKTIAGFGGATLDARAATRAFEQAVDDASTAAKKNGKTLDTSTQAGRDNQAALDGIASAASQAAAKILEQTGSQEDAAAAIRRGRKAFVDQAVQMGLSRTAAKKLADQLGLIPSNVNTAVGVTGVDAARTKVADFNRYLDTLTGSPKQFLVSAAVNYSYLSGGTPAKKAAGGPITGGVPGRDSVPILAMPGEHVLTVRDVKAMGGQGGVYAFRAGLRTLPGYAAGGAIGDAKDDAAKYDRQADLYARQVDTLNAQLKRAKRLAASTAKAYEKAQDVSSTIYGKGTAEKKHKAVLDAKAAKKAADDAAKKVTDLQKRISSAEDKQQTAVQNQQDAAGRAQTLRYAREDFVSGERRGVTDPLTYVDQLRSMSRDDNYSAARRKTFLDAANRYETALVKLGKQSEEAATKLSDLKSSAEQMKTGIASAITGGFGVTSAKYADTVMQDWVENVESGWKTVDGIQYQTFNQVTHAGGTTLGGFDAAGIDAFYGNASNSTGQFALDLQALANRGVNGQLLAEIAGYGVEQGSPIAKALLSGTQGQIDSINTNYQRVQDNGKFAGGIVADTNFKALIDDAQANADKITAQIAADGDKLRKLIASAFGLTGYAIGTMNASAGWHLVGEKGPELLSFAGGEQVLNADRTRSMIAAATSRQQAVSVAGPTSVTIIDADGALVGTMRVAARGVAQTEIALDQMRDSVLEWGKGA